MPFCNVITNKQVDKAQLGQAVTEALSKGFGKPVQYVMVNIEISDGLMFGGSSDPCAMLVIQGIGGDLDQVSEGLAQVMETEAGIPRQRVFINHQSYERSQWFLA